jgi:hypothetical protein
VGCGGRVAVRGGDPRQRDTRGRVGGAVPWPEVRSVWRRFSAAKAAHVSLRTLPGAVPVLEVKARSRMTPRGARGWLPRRLRHGGAAHASGSA